MNLTAAEWMEKALSLSERGRLTAPPNPWVGAIVVKGGEKVGEGFHVAPGTPHAEVIALREAGEKARGATLYSTLEPCCHFGRTPPCTDLILSSGIKEVVIGVLDPDQRVKGLGAELLREKGLKVEVGILADSIERSLSPYLHHRSKGLPYVIGKSAFSLDGKITDSNGSSKWISSPEARLDGHRMRALSGAILIGCETAIRDTPSLTARDVPKNQIDSLRVVLDSRGRVFDGPLLSPYPPTLIFTSQRTSQNTIKFWEEKGVESIVLPVEEGPLPLIQVLEILGKRGIIQVLIEGGAKLLQNAYEEELLDELITYISPKFFGEKGTPFLSPNDPELVTSPPSWKPIETVILGESVKIRWMKKRNSLDLV